MTSKPFSWSYSRLKNFETCGKRHWHIDLQKDFKEEESEQLQWGDLVHKAAANRLSIGKALPAGMEVLEDWCFKLQTAPGKILVEQKLALARDLGACGYFDKGSRPTWFRAVGDVIKLAPPVALIADWKTGKILEDSVQLGLAAACVFAHYPDIKAVRSEFIWLKEGPGITTREDFTRDDMPGLWRALWPRIEALEHAWNTTTYPANPGRLCRKWCPVTSCPHHGE